MQSMRSPAAETRPAATGPAAVHCPQNHVVGVSTMATDSGPMLVLCTTVPGPVNGATALATRQLERERRLHGGGRSIMGGLLLGWDRDKDEAEQERVAELEARAEENLAMRDALRSLNPTYRAMRNGFRAGSTGWRWPPRAWPSCRPRGGAS